MKSDTDMVVMNGNAAVALGAMAAGITCVRDVMTNETCNCTLVDGPCACSTRSKGSTYDRMSTSSAICLRRRTPVVVSSETPPMTAAMRVKYVLSSASLRRRRSST